MDRSRSRRNAIDQLFVNDGDQVRAIEKLANRDSSINWIEIGTTGAPAFAHSWVQYNSNDFNYAHAGFSRTSSGIVVMRGLIAAGTLGQSAFTLPAGFRPLKYILFPAATNTGYGELRIFSDGTVNPWSGGTTYFSIACCFRAEQ